MILIFEIIKNDNMFSAIYSVSKSFWISLSVFFLICLGYYINVLFKTDFHYTYPLDDVYIHLAIAKNFALHDVWGITQYEFSSTSSSPIYTYLLSLYIQIFGNNDQIPLYFNIVFGIALLFYLNKYYSEIFRQNKYSVFALFFTVSFSVLHLQLLSGMEHMLHVLLFVINIYYLQKIEEKKIFQLGFFVSLALMGLVRFESMFYILLLALFFLIIKRWKRALATLIIGFLPIVLFCYCNKQLGGYWFPNSVVVKGTSISFDGMFLSQMKTIFLDKLFLNISFYKVGIFPLLIVFYFIYSDFKKKNLQYSFQQNWLSIVLCFSLLAHSMFGDFKGGFRYEAYLMVGFCMVLIPKIMFLFTNFRQFINQEKFLSLMVVLSFMLMIYKVGYSHLLLNNAGKNVYEQQVQSAKFLHKYYNNSKIVANDIGVISYYTNIQLLDIVALGSTHMIPYKRAGKDFDLRFENYLTKYSKQHKYDLAIVYEDWLDGHVPKNWQKVAVLRISNLIGVAGNEVSIYSISNDEKEKLKQNIKNFDWNKNVEVIFIN